MENELTISLKLNDFKDKGLYLFLKNGEKIVLSRDRIEKLTRKFWEDPSRIPDRVKEAVEFQRCPFCTIKDNDICDAIRPILPFLEVIDRFVSFEKVVGVYKGDNEEVIYAADTNMQNALRYVSILSLISYCRIGQEYLKYFYGVMPLMSVREIASRIYINMFWIHDGHKEEMENAINRFKQKIKITSRNQVNRLNLICRNDSFMNAFVNTQIITEFLSMRMDSVLQQAFEDYGGNVSTDKGKSD